MYIKQHKHCCRNKHSKQQCRTCPEKSRKFWQTFYCVLLHGQQVPVSLEELPLFRPVANKSLFFYWNHLGALHRKPWVKRNKHWKLFPAKQNCLWTIGAAPAPALQGVTHLHRHLSRISGENVLVRTANAPKNWGGAPGDCCTSGEPGCWAAPGWQKGK